MGWFGRLLRVHSPSGHLDLVHGCWCQRLVRPRWVQRVYARVFGYFWAPCREWGGVHVNTAEGSFVVCRVCGPKWAARAREMGL